MLAHLSNLNCSFFPLSYLLLWVSLPVSTILDYLAPIGDVTAASIASGTGPVPASKRLDPDLVSFLRALESDIYLGHRPLHTGVDDVYPVRLESTTN